MLMAHVTIKRYERDVTITLHTTTVLATSLRLNDVAGAVVSFGTMSTNSSTIQMWGGTSETGTFSRLYKADGSVADITLAPSSTAGRIYSLPDEVFALPWLKIVSGTTNSTGTTGIVSLKS
jgi:hypothetical protein